MKTLLSFDTLITPQFMKIFYYIGVVFCVLSGLATFISILVLCINAAQMAGESTTLPTIIGLILGSIVALITTVLSIILTRIGCETVLVVFMIRDELAWQRENTQKHA
ncbi:DUF4282 domain-containing protein [Gluconacetobacter entanii]|uniref:DUF4282 domain-containing protein n=1 Tax=Gluconacetobacter entanii TaxID=108528 RepID=A0ABT3K4E1_9PROT|nr:DUF4282 domain-containing protein [Gluconacetobacter entanii]MBE7619237.1 DUF4282 domain-containing protein [Komagataeibacter sp. FXV2]MCE2577693.1 DUF4282 domain-containing protein [Komagataeibacter sp. FNDCR1]MBY4639867.1 DUF4282 domain-containing protein [Gluconacetobacter entanii]MCW4581110.1 DUF4282 domain-containing protein [Gluconacetobacter entanii]MCW4584370.1 DUF4282 domain-containing protein [Gluconacetobacter entanii]